MPPVPVSASNRFPLESNANPSGKLSPVAKFDRPPPGEISTILPVAGAPGPPTETNRFSPPAETAGRPSPAASTVATNAHNASRDGL